MRHGGAGAMGWRGRGGLTGVAGGLAWLWVTGVAMGQPVVVPGKSDPWLGGMPAGARASGGDVAPKHSPVLVEGLALRAGMVLVFEVSGSVSHVGRPLGLTPDGGNPVGHGGGAQNGIASLVAPINSLVGVFLGKGPPDGAPAPGVLRFARRGLAFATLAPLVRQPFFIGDGLDGTGSGVAQRFSVPEGATRLYLGTMDGFGWFNNSGAFRVVVREWDGKGGGGGNRKVGKE